MTAPVSGARVVEACTHTDDSASTLGACAACIESAPFTDPRQRILTFRTRDHPEAGGRLPLLGEREWRFTFSLEDGETLTVATGAVGRRAFIGILHEEATDDAIEEAWGVVAPTPPRPGREEILTAVRKVGRIEYGEPTDLVRLFEYGEPTDLERLFEVADLVVDTVLAALEAKG